MLKQWNWSMNAFNLQAITGNPWTNINDYPRNNYLNPKKVVVKKGTTIIQPITWTAFPNRVNWYFNTSQGNPLSNSQRLNLCTI